MLPDAPLKSNNGPHVPTQQNGIRSPNLSSEPKKSSSTTELCCCPSEDETENATDIEDIPRDPEDDSAKAFMDNLFKDKDNEDSEATRRLHSEKAIQIIKENSEILDKILKKKKGDPIQKPASAPVPAPSSASTATLESSAAPKPITFNPFPKPVIRRNKEVGRKLGLYAK